MADEVLAEFRGVSKRFEGSAPALDNLNLRIVGKRVTGLVGPDGAGKTTSMRLLAGLLVASSGSVTVCGHDAATQFAALHEAVSYMPQRFGLYEDLTVRQNLDLHADLRGVVGEERRATFDRLMKFTGLAPFTDRLAGKLSGGMKQKLGLACALVRRPQLLLLDEPSVGVDPVSRRELWKIVYELVESGIGVVWSTAYLDEAERCSSVLVLHQGKLLYDGPPGDQTRKMKGRSFAVLNTGDQRRQVLARALRQKQVIDGTIQGQSVRLVLAKDSQPPAEKDLGNSQARIVPVEPRFEDAFVALLGGVSKEEIRQATSEDGAGPNRKQPGKESAENSSAVIEADGLTKRFGSFTAADHITFKIGRGEIFGLLGPNGAGKSTVFKMMCGLLRPTEGKAQVAGLDLAHAASEARSRIGYMAQKFSLYGDLSVRQNLEFFAGVYGLTGKERDQASAAMVRSFALDPYLQTSASELPLGFKQRLAMACATMHGPEVLFLDEPTSGVDPLTRREFWARINAMVGRGVTIMVTTHFLDEAEYCDRVGIVYRGRVIASGAPDELKAKVRTDKRPDPTLEDAFIALVEQDDQKNQRDSKQGSGA